jgi:2'-5' RNA ligase
VTAAKARLFFALWPGEELRAALTVAFAPAVAAAGGRAVPAHNLHLTLAFLGAVPAAALDRLVALGAALDLPQAGVRLDRLDWWRRAEVLVAAASEPPAALLELQAHLRRLLNEAGFRIDSQPFRPHVTLARKVSSPPPSVQSAVVWPIATAALVESVPAPGGSRYTPLTTWTRSG